MIYKYDDEIKILTSETVRFYPHRFYRLYSYSGIPCEFVLFM